MRRLLGVGLLVVAAVFAAPAVRADEPPPRAYTVHVPPGKAPKGGRPLVVYLHGCIQTAADAEAATHFDSLADQYGFVVAYIQQNITAPVTAPVADGNGVGCWNWFLSDDQDRDKGEPAAIAAVTRQVIADYGIDASRVYVEGISAGADMAVILGATYPDLYAAVGAVEGCPYRTCTDLSGALAYRAMEGRARTVPMFVVQGTADTVNAAPLGGALVKSWLGVDDFVDNGAPDGSFSAEPYMVENQGLSTDVSPGSGDPCVRNQNWPCPGGVIGFKDQYPSTVARWADHGGCNVLEAWAIHGMEHAQPDAASGPFTDPLGPDISAASWQFFARNSLRGPCTVTASKHGKP